jgi:hypothetical protein
MVRASLPVSIALLQLKQKVANRIGRDPANRDPANKWVHVFFDRGRAKRPRCIRIFNADVYQKIGAKVTEPLIARDASPVRLLASCSQLFERFSLGLAIRSNLKAFPVLVDPKVDASTPTPI